MKKPKTEPAPETPTNDPKLFLDLGPKECRFALGEFHEPPKLFCAAETEDSPYCPYHQGIVYTRHPANN